MQLLAHRKQDPVLPTLVVSISDKERKRRSSRAAGMVSTNKESGATVLWFRVVPDEPQPSLHDWARFILAKSSDGNSPISPVFTSPFAPRPREGSDSYVRPGSGSNGGRPNERILQHKSSTATYSTGPRDRQTAFSSESPSLHSKRSDLSSPSSSNNQGHKGQYHSRMTHEYNGEFIEGWTSAQGRGALGSPSRAAPEVPPPLGPLDVNAPPAPGETILDRAFKLGHIPFAEERIPGQEKLSSIARFDALMREAEEKRKQREEAEKAEQLGLRSAFDEDDSSDESASEISSEDNEAFEKPLMSPSAERALAFIASRHDGDRNSQSQHRPTVSRNHLSFHASIPSNLSHLIPSRPHTSHSKLRPGNSRTHSTPQLIPMSASAELSSLPRQNTDDAGRHSKAEKRLSTSSIKGLSINDITKRLSSTSSLLLVQTNVSGGSSRASMELGDHSTAVHRNNLGVRPPPSKRETQRCGWRGSVGVVTTDGGFL